MNSHASPAPGEQHPTGDQPEVGNLVLRDSLTLLALALAALILFAGTTLLFRSFTSRRDRLAREFADQGKQALQRHQTGAAIDDLRASLEFGPEDRNSRLLLAEALAEEGRAGEAMNYFAGLREADPADGFINLELARLYRKSRDTSRAIDSYRAATLGLWEADGATKRLNAQLEFSEYLISLGRLGAARAELLSATGNAPESAPVNILLGDEFRKANGAADALDCYERAARLQPDNFEALQKTGRQAYELGHFAVAHRMLQNALERRPDTPEAADLSTLSRHAARLQELSLNPNLPPGERESHLLLAATIAKHRLSSCLAIVPRDTTPHARLEALEARWTDDAFSNRRGPMLDTTTYDRTTARTAQLIFDTETQASGICGAPSGDDALLLVLAQTQSVATPESPR